MADTSTEELLPFLLQRNNVATYEDGFVVIGDRRKFPFEKTVVRCTDVESVAQAIENMVTQGGGIWIVAAYGMVMAARHGEGKSKNEAHGYLQKAYIRLVNTRPTNTALARIIAKAMAVGDKAIAEGVSVENALLTWTEQLLDDVYKDYALMGRLGADMIEDGDGILTVCFAEMSFLFALAMAKEDGKHIRAYVPETRPYLQGARLTAPSIHEINIPVQIIGDNMPAHLLAQGKVQKYFTAADLVTLDGHVVNKIGTFQNAISARYHGVPYFAFCREPDREVSDCVSVVIEERNPAEMKMCQGTATTISEIDAYYPAFDITPPHLVSRVITPRGLLNPYDLKRYFS